MTDDTCGQDPKVDRIRFDPKADPRQDPKAQQSGTGISKRPQRFDPNKNYQLE